jgi:glycosyltransferase involved in cell wall biosynthesis
VRILICALDGPEPRTNGIRLAVGALLDELRRVHEIRYLGYRMADQRDVMNSAELRLIEPPARPIRGSTVLRATVTGRPWESDRLAAGMREALREEIEAFKPDVVHVTRWALAGLGREIEDLGSVLTAFDAWHLNVDANAAVVGPLRRPLIRAEARRVRRFEGEEFARFDRVVVVSEEDKEALLDLNSQLRISVIPNGVDSQFFSDEPDAAVAGRIVFTGHMGYPPNIVAAKFLAEEILPRVRQVDPAAHVTLVGRDPTPEVLRLADHEAVTVTGTVDDVRPWLRSGQVFVCPMLTGTGIKNKLLEAMATGLACVVTPLALQGIAVTPGREVLVGASADELAARAAAVLNSDLERKRLGRAARDFVREEHSWSAAATSYEHLYAAVLSEAADPLRD